MIRLEQLTVPAGAFTLHNVSLEIPEGAYTLVIGPTGSGKTTLLEAIAGHVPVRDGRVFLRGVDVTHLPPEQRGVGFVYQQYHLFPHLRVRDNIRYGLRHGTQSPAEQDARVESLAGMLGIEALLDRGVGRLSGGEQQRVALARALAPRPSILLLDEPFAAVDPSMRHLLRRELRTLHEREGTTTLQVTHDFDDALRLGDQVAVLSEGRVAQAGPPDQVFRFPNSPFVARFIGAGTVLAGVLERSQAGTEGDPFAARFQSGALSLEVIASHEGPAHAVIRPEDILLSRDPFPGTPRNRFPARITRVERTGALAYVHLDAGVQLVAVITSATADEMQPAVGEVLHAALKATAVHLV
ncbi:MAG: ABC transporter ATP-binding protein [Gemmatimonadota bacterium]|nr:ABC transporter ATP-binding protein [Gemmatimonadota bacterium]